MQSSFLCTGKPTPVVSWLVNEKEVESRLEEIEQNIVVSKLRIPQLRREHRNTTYKCRASNTNLIPALEKTVLLDVYRTYYKQRPFCSASAISIQLIPSETAVGENPVETGDPGNGEGLLDLVRDDRLAS